MSKILDKEQTQIVKEFLKERYYMPHIAVSWCLERMGITLSPSAVMNFRKRHELPYKLEGKIGNAIQLARDKGIPITHDFLKMRLPILCQEYREYLVGFYARQDRVNLPPIRVNTMAHMISQLTR